MDRRPQVAFFRSFWSPHLRTSVAGSACGFGGIIGPVGLAGIAGSGNYLKPGVPLPEFPLAFVYLGCWFLMTGTVYSMEQIDRELTVSA